MKKLSKTQQEIERLAKRLPEPADAFRRFDKRIRAKKDYNDSCEVYESFYSIVGKYAVERTFQVGKDYCNEVSQWWIDTDTGKIHYREKKSTLIYGGNYGYRFLGYDESTTFHFKPKSGMEDKYGYRFVKPWQKGKEPMTDTLERKGVTQEDIDEFGIKKLSETLADTRMETILKHSIKDFYWFIKHGRELTDAVWSAYKITIRNHYRIRNMQVWYDMIKEMEYVGMDVRNAKYVCARAYKKLHDDVVERANRKREKERKIADAKKAKEMMEKNKGIVEERIRKFSDLAISNGSLHCVVLITYEDYREEGARMHHCVGGYFDRKNSLILSFRDNDGKRVETVEISLTSFSIIQSRGLQNKATSHHKEIIDLVESNMWQIEQRYAKAA